MRSYGKVALGRNTQLHIERVARAGESHARLRVTSENAARGTSREGSQIWIPEHALPELIAGLEELAVSFGRGRGTTATFKDGIRTKGKP